MRSGLASNKSVAVVCSLLPRRGVGCPVSVSAAGVVAGVRKGRLQLLEDWLLDLVSHNLSKRMSGFLLQSLRPFQDGGWVHCLAACYEYKTFQNASSD